MEQAPDPLDIFLPSATELLANTDRLLWDNGIAHGELSLMADVSQNVAVSDGERVFVKVYRRKDGLLEPRNTRLAQSYGAPTLDLLLSEPWCSVWKYEHLEPLPRDALPLVLRAVRRVHEATRDADLIERLDYEEALAVVTGRLKKVSPSGLTELVGELATQVCGELTRATQHSPLVFTHADLQFRNMGVADGRPVIYDWEICKMAPVELELSKLEENLFTEGSWEPGEVASLYGGEVDEDLLFLATQLRYAQNMAFFLERGDYHVVERQLEAYLAYRSTRSE